MAKYNITYSCGHEGTVQLFGKSEERERKIKYYEEFGLCTECYKKQKQEENAKLGFLIGGSVADTLSEKGEIQVCLSFAGDTLPHKEEIKTLGYRWTAVDASQMAYMHKPDMGWVKVVPYEHLEEEKEKAFAIGAKEAEISDRELANQKERYQEMLSEQKLFRKHNKKKLEAKKQLADLLPEKPECIQGKYWNEKIYGKTGKYFIYLDGNKVNIPDEKAAELEEYLGNMRKYREKKKELMERQKDGQ